MIAVRPLAFDIRASRRPATTARLCEAYHCNGSPFSLLFGHSIT